jgi:hypothetical protein
MSSSRSPKRRKHSKIAVGGPNHRRYCTASGKYSYPTKKAALSAAAQSQKHAVAELHTYKCPFCRDFHITSQPRRANG